MQEDFIMIGVLQGMLRKIQELNNGWASKIIPEKNITEGFEDLKDFEHLIKKLDHDVKSLEKLNCDDVNSIIEKLISVHIELQSVIWHVDQMHEIVVEVIKNYRRVVEEEK